MKKSLLLMSAAMLASGMAFANLDQRTVTFSKSPVPAQASTSRAQVRANAGGEKQTLVYTNASDVEGYYSLNNTPSKFYVYMAVEMTVEDQKPYIGNSITAVNVMTGAGVGQNNKPADFPVDKAMVYVSEKLDAVPEKTTEGELNKTEGTVNSIELEEPYVITGEKPIYFGYILPISSTCYYIPADCQPTAANVNNLLLATVSKLTTTPKFSNMSNQEPGSLCLSINITGDNLPENLALPRNVGIESYMKPGKFSYDVTLKNVGLNEVNSVNVRTSLSNGTVYDFPMTFTTPLGTNAVVTFPVNDVPNDAARVMTLSATVTEVNGVAIDNPVPATGVLTAYNDGYERKLVIEEATGTWCGYCPRGIVMLEYLKERYPDWIRIGVHQGDLMAVSAYQDFIYDYIPGFPYAVCNRTTEIQPMGDYDNYYAPTYKYFTSFPAYVKVDFSAECTEDKKTVNIKSQTEFSVDSDIEHSLSFVLVEDGVGPYNQSNYFSGNASNAWGWEKKGSSVSMLFDDVARAIVDYPGIEGSIPSGIKSGTVYDYNLDIPLKSIKGEAFRIVALVTNNVTGEIVNAKELSWYKDNGAGVEGVADDSEAIEINVVDGDIIVTGATNVAVYTLDGRNVGTTGLSNGVYIVKADSVSKKVLVK